MPSAASLPTVAQALSDPTRLEILRVIRADERTVQSIADGFTFSRPAISQHLRVLRDAELVSVREQGTRNYYRARPEGLAALRSWLDDFWGDALDRLATEAEAEQRRKDQK